MDQTLWWSGAGLREVSPTTWTECGKVTYQKKRKGSLKRREVVGKLKSPKPKEKAFEEAVDRHVKFC